MTQQVDKAFRTYKNVHERSYSPRRTYLPDIYERAGLILASLFMLDSSGQRLDEKDLLKHISRAAHWAANRSRHWLFFLSCLAVEAALCLPENYRMATLLLLLILGYGLATAPYDKLPWERRYIRSGGASFSAGLLLMAGTASLFTGHFVAAGAIRKLTGLSVAMILIILGLTLQMSSQWVYHRWRTISQDFNITTSPDEYSRLFSGTYALLFLLAISSVSFYGTYSHTLDISGLMLVSINLFYAAWTLSALLMLKSSHRSFTHACRQAELQLERLFVEKRG